MPDASMQQALTDAVSLAMQRRFPEAEAAYLKITQDFPPTASVFTDLGAIYALQQKLDQALPCFDLALQLDPNYAAAHSNRARALMQMKNYSRALESLANALRFTPVDAQLWSDLGIAHHETNNDPEALNCFSKVIALEPNRASGHAYLAQILRNLGREDEALAEFEKAVQLDPVHPEYHMALGMSLLLHGDFARGWREFEYRWLTPMFKSDLAAHRGPQWTGREPLQGKTIYLRPEQGLGDTIQFIRYAPWVAKLGARIIAGSHKPLKRLIATVPGVTLALTESEHLPDHDYYVPILSLPRIFGTNLANIPRPGPYLHVDDRLVKKWRQRLGLGVSRKFNIGLAWAGNPKHTQDRHRSIPLEKFLPLSNVECLKLFSLQKPPGSDQLKPLASKLQITDLASDLKDLADTAAVMKSLDLVITVDTFPAHLAGALGRPVWTLLSLSNDWRWLMNRSDTPWYPSMRLYRQKKLDHWDDVISQVALDLRAKLHS